MVPTRDLGVPFLVAFGLVPRGTRKNATRNATSFLELHHRPSSSWCSKMNISGVSIRKNVTFELDCLLLVLALLTAMIDEK